MRDILLSLFLVMTLNACKPAAPDTVTIGIIEPLEHKAMTEIVAGFTDTFKKSHAKPVIIKVANAQNDPNLQRAIIQRMIDAHYDIVLPIGASPTQMTVAMAHGAPVIALASDLSQSDREKLHPCNVAVVHDEISPAQLVDFIHAVYPQLKYLTLIHSSADKVFPDVKKVIEKSGQYGITVHHVMVSSLPELYTATQSLPKEAQAIFILKDSLIVSGISTLAQVAAARHIPLITSDQGSVQDGAGFALGVHEREIGVQGAKLAVAALDGKKLCEMPIVEMKNLVVFINPAALQQQRQDMKLLIQSAQQFHYQTENVDAKNNSGKST
jgi:putative ABC transport system substrate-binding protein